MAFRSLLVLSYLACQRLDADIPRHPQLGAGGQRPNHLTCLELAGLNGVLPAVLGDSQSRAPRRVTRRLSRKQSQHLAGYQAGASTRQLATLYGISKTSV